MSVFAMSTTEAIDLDLSGLTSVLAVVLGIGVIVLLVWMWRIGHQLEAAIEPSAEPSAELSGRPSSAPTAPFTSTAGDGAGR